jgi:hypothetical protein
MATHLKDALEEDQSSGDYSESRVRNAIHTLEEDSNRYDYLKPSYLTEMAEYLKNALQ